MTASSDASAWDMEQMIRRFAMQSPSFRAGDTSLLPPFPAPSEPVPSVLSARLIHGIGSLTTAEKQIVGAIMGKRHTSDVLAAMRALIEKRQQREDEKHRKAWQFLDDPSAPNPWPKHKSYPTRRLTFEPEPTQQMKVPVNSAQEPTFQFMDDPMPDAPSPRSGYHAGPASWRFKADELDDAMFHLADGETIYCKPINKNFNRRRKVAYYMCQWNDEKRWLTHDVNYRFDFWYSETDSRGRVTHHFSEV